MVDWILRGPWLVAGAVLSRTVYRPTVDNLDSLRESIVEQCEEWAGIPYGFGKKDPGTGRPPLLDCSGASEGVYGRRGLYLPHGSSAQYQFCVDIEEDEVRAADLVFKHRGGKVFHVGVADGSGWLWEEPQKGGVMQRVEVSSWTRRDDIAVTFGRHPNLV